MDRPHALQTAITPWEVEEELEQKGRTAFQGPPPVKELAAAKAKLFEGMTPEEAADIADLLFKPHHPPKPLPGPPPIT